MATEVMTLRDYADLLDELATEWEGEEPVVLVGDVTGSVQVRADDGFSKYGPVGYSQECFDDNGVYELGQKADHRFFETMLLAQEHVSADTQEALNDGD